MKTIAKELARMRAIKDDKGAEFFIQRRFKIDMEWWVLGRVCEVLDECNLAVPVYARPCQPETPKPDFITFDKNRHQFCPVEIVQVLERGRKMAEEYKKGKQLDFDTPPEVELMEPMDHCWEPLITVLNKKSGKPYPKATWLLIYFNIPYERISEIGSWHETILANAINWNFPTGSFKKILVLNAPGNSLVEIFPEMGTIKAEH